MAQPLTGFKENQPVLVVEHTLSIFLQCLPFLNSSNCNNTYWLPVTRIKNENYKDYRPVNQESQQGNKYMRGI